MRKKLTVLLLTFVLLVQLIIPTYGIPNEFWKLSERYTEALNSKNNSDIIKYGKEIEKLYEKEPMSQEKAEILNPRFKSICDSYLALEDYDNAVIYLKKHIEISQYLNEKDNVINGKELLNHIDLMVEVYAATKNTNDLPYYKEKYEPKLGTYYGRIESESYEPRMNESAVLIYVHFFSEKISDFSYKIEPQSDADRVIEMAWNMSKENDDLKKILEPSSDEYIKSNLEYLSTLKSPVFLRIGAEMNVWNNLAEPELFKSAYIKIAKMAREIAPNVALVFSPNYSSNRTVTIKEYYPGDEWVDWIGVSLYSNKYSGGNIYTQEPQPVHLQTFYGVGDYANPVVLLKNLINEVGGKKPIMISEAASGHSIKGNGTDLTGYAKNNMEILYRYINMVFPQVKCIMYFDNEQEISATKYVYALNENSTMKAAYDEFVSENPTLIKNYGEETYGYAKLSDFSDNITALDLSTYIVLPGYKQAVCEYYVDGALYKSTNDMPYDVSIDLNSLSVGTHRIKVVVKGGTNYTKIKEYNLVKGSNGVVTCTAYLDSAKNISALPAESKVLVNGDLKSFEAYLVNGNNYFKLRDIAAAVNGSEKQFEVSFNASENAILLNANTPYTKIGNEMLPSGNKTVRRGYMTDSKLYLNNEKFNLTGYNIDGNNYFKLRDLGMIFDFQVVWNGGKNTIEILTNTSYTPE